MSESIAEPPSGVSDSSLLGPPGEAPGRSGDDEMEAAARAYQQFRLHHTPEEEAALDSWCAATGGNPEAAWLFRDVHRSDPAAAARLAETLTTLPEVGSEWLGFRLLAELGRGAFGRVYLAQQGDLANRYVALKVSTDLFQESQTLAQLQHTNIVPIYSIHQSGPNQAVCMPYFGSTTLGDVFRDLAPGDSLPASGKVLVRTLNKSRSTAPRRKTSRSTPPSGSGLSAPAPRPGSDGPPETALRPAANLERLEKLNYVEAVLWIGARVCEGLQHAHERGIVHRDLKPANILLTDEGQPMLLDFNLSDDTKLRSSASAARVGGTLPYMSPEHLEDFRGGRRAVDARSDVYSLGVILYELLSGQPPFPRLEGPLETVLPRMIADRRTGPGNLRQRNRMVSPAVAAILHHCLEPDPDERYPSARHLLEDLERHLQDLPLQHIREPSLRERARKWARRHRRGTAFCLGGLLAAFLVAAPALGYLARERAQDRAAQAAWEQFRQDRQAVQFLLNARSPNRDQLDEGIERVRAVLAPYRVLEDPSWRDRPAVRHLPEGDRQRLDEEVEELLLLLARATALRAEHDGDAARERLDRAGQYNALAEHDGRLSRSGWLQRADLARLRGDEAESRRCRTRADETPLRTARDHFLLGVEYLGQGRFREALGPLQEATRRDPQYFWAWFTQGVCHFELHEDHEALACYNACLALWPAAHPFLVNRGLVYHRQRRLPQARADLDAALRLRPDIADLYLLRALILLDLKQHAEALADLNEAVQRGTAQTRVYFLRAAARAAAGDAAGARRDREEGLRRTPSEEISWTARGVQRLAGDPRGALADFDEALKINPRYVPALQNKAHVLSDRLGRPEEALAVLDRAVAVAPDDVRVRVGRGVVRARLRKAAEARADAAACLARDDSPPTLYQVGNIFALTSRQAPGDRPQALAYLARALRGGFGLDLVDGDSDYDPIRGDPAFCRVVDAARALVRGQKSEFRGQ